MPPFQAELFIPPLRGELVVNGFNLAQEDVDYIALIQDYEIKFVQGYPSSIAALLGRTARFSMT